MSISVTDPMDRAFKRTGLVLFRTGSVGKWFALGFCAFLAYLGEGCQAQVQFPGPGGGGAPGGPGAGGPQQPTVAELIEQYWAWIVGIGGGALVLGAALGALVLWLQARGTFLFLHGLAVNQAAVVKPWRAFRELGNSYFGFRLIVAAIAAVAVLATAAVASWLVWPDIQAERFTGRSAAAVALGAAVVVPVGLGYFLVGLVVHDFVAPAMYTHGVRVRAGWGVFWREMLPGQFWTIVLFYLLRLVINIAIGAIAFVVTCLTCCLAAVPYLGTVILLPLYVFDRSYTLHFVQQFGARFRIFRSVVDEGLCPVCGYDLRGNPEAEQCPECGADLEAMRKRDEDA